MEITVLLFGRSRELAGAAQETITVKEGAVLQDLFRELGRRHGAAFSREIRRRSTRVLVNGREAGLIGGMEAPMIDKETVVILPPMFGG